MKFKVGDRIRIAKKLVYRQGLMSEHQADPTTYTRVFHILRVDGTDNVLVDFNEGTNNRRKDGWWFDVGDVYKASIKPIIGGKLV